MRHFSSFIVRMFALMTPMSVLVSCVNEVNTDEFRKIRVGIHSGAVETRTSVLSNALSAEWEDGDELAVWARNSASSYILASQPFGLYGDNVSKGFFTADLLSPMPEDTYTYYCTYPEPLSINGTKVDFNLPAVQDGKMSGGTDIMIATPVQHGALAELSNPDDHSNLSLEMNRIMHQFRFWLPTGENVLQENIEEIRISMPRAVVGRVTADFADPAAMPTLSSASSELTLELTNPISESDFENADFACAAICPSAGAYTEADSLGLTIYSKTYKSVLEPVSLAGRDFQSGHSTPIRLLPREFVPYYRVTLLVGDNFIGEPLKNISISSADTKLIDYQCPADGVVRTELKIEYTGESGRQNYQAILDAVNAGTATMTYETENAIYSRPLQVADLATNENRTKINLGDVPYLLYEDFSNALDDAHNDAYSAGTSSDTNLGGYILNGKLVRDGWNAARYMITGGSEIRINVRYQSGAWVVGRYCGRLDTPRMSYLKDGVSVDLMLEFREAFYVPAGYSYNDTNNTMAKFHVGTHTIDEYTPIDGVTNNLIASSANIIYTSGTFASEDISMLKPMSLTIPAATSNTRIVFFPDTNRNNKHIAANCCYYLYLDDIKVYIKH